jgi:alkylation response protein AidB-like acyl-CoA dehydrogenase
VIDDAKANGKWLDPTTRDRLMRLLTAERALQITNLRGYASRQTGNAPGPEGSITKLLRSTLSQQIADAAVDVRGLGALASLDDLWGARDLRELMAMDGRHPDRIVVHEFLMSRSHTILGGTSEIQRNIIAERVLGLPKDPDPWKNQAWKDIPRN